jgi:hypothetical protein
MKAVHKRHCWECRRRCLVCDFTEPACRRCSAAGVQCPGYGHVKPTRLKWLSPGRVVARADRKRQKPLTVSRFDMGAEARIFPEAVSYCK